MAFAKKFMLLILAVSFLGSGCRATNAIFPNNDKVLTYPLAFDITYLRTLEAIENLDGWILAFTEKERGIILARNSDYARLGDADTRDATILVKRIGRRETGVELFKESKKVIGGDNILNEIDYFLSLEVAKDQAIRQRREAATAASPIYS